MLKEQFHADGRKDCCANLRDSSNCFFPSLWKMSARFTPKAAKWTDSILRQNQHASLLRPIVPSIGPDWPEAGPRFRIYLSEIVSVFLCLPIIHFSFCEGEGEGEGISQKTFSEVLNNSQAGKRCVWLTIFLTQAKSGCSFCLLCLNKQ